MDWTRHARERISGRMQGLTSAAEVAQVLDKCKHKWQAVSGQTGVRVRTLDKCYTLNDSAGSEVWAVVDTAGGRPPRVVTLMLRREGQGMNNNWTQEVR